MARIKTGTVANLGLVSKYMSKRGMLGIIWGGTIYDAKRSSSRRMTVILLRGKPRIRYQFGVDWYWKTDFGYENADGNCLPFLFVRKVADSGLFWAKDLGWKYFGKIRQTIGNYLREFPMSLERVRILPNRSPDNCGLAFVLPREAKITGKLAIRHSVDGLCFGSWAECYAYMRDNIRFFSKIIGVIRTDEGSHKFNHWKIGPIRP